MAIKGRGQIDKLAHDYLDGFYQLPCSKIDPDVFQAYANSIDATHAFHSLDLWIVTIHRC